MRLTLTFLFAAALGALGALASCASDQTGQYRSALTGDSCTPNATYQARPAPSQGQGGNQCVGTSNGDNCDDTHSGKIDCIGDGNSGQGDDKKHNCSFPQPGCDDSGCCDGDLVADPPLPPTDPAPPSADPIP
jgi:hypothetical protein